MSTQYEEPQVPSNAGIILLQDDGLLDRAEVARGRSSFRRHHVWAYCSPI